MKNSSFKYVPPAYYSNCLIEAIKAKLKNPKIKLYLCKPTSTQSFHIMWDDGYHTYDFSDFPERDVHLKWFQCLVYKGCIRRFKSGFAKKYSKIRNGRKEL